MVVVDEEAFRGLPASIAMYRAGQALVLGDVAGTMTHARRALDLVDEDDHVGRGAAAALLGLAYWTSGDLEAAHRWYAEGMASLEQAGYISDVVGWRHHPGGHPDRARSAPRGDDARTSGACSSRQRTARPSLRGAADMHVGHERAPP